MVNNKVQNQEIDYKFIYCGEDSNFFDSMNQRYKKDYASRKFESKQFVIQKEDEILSVLRDVSMCEGVDTLFLDCTKNGEYYQKFGKLFLSMMTNRRVHMIALVSQDAHEEAFRKLMICGIKMIHKKGVDLGAITYHGLFLAQSEWAISPKYVSALKVNDEFMAIQYGRIGYITLAQMHIESDMYFDVGHEMTIETFFPKRLNFKRVKVIQSGQENLYYNFQRSYDIETIWPEDENLKAKAQEINEYIFDQQSKSRSKQTKVLVIDDQLELLKQGQKMIDSYDYSFRFDRFFESDFSSYYIYSPQIIVFCMQTKLIQEEDELDESEEVAPPVHDGPLKNDKVTLARLVSDLKKASESPIIIAFNGQLTNLELTNLAYPKLISYKGAFSLDTIVQLAEKFYLKALSVQDANNKNASAQKYFCNKNHDDSIFMLEHYLSVKEINESSVTFESPYRIPYYTCFYLKGRIEMNVTVVPKPDAAQESLPKGPGPYEFMGLIHGMGEVERNELRRYINDILGRHKREEEKREKEEFAKLNAKMRAKKEIESKKDDDGSEDGDPSSQ